MHSSWARSRWLGPEEGRLPREEARGIFGRRAAALQSQQAGAGRASLLLRAGAPATRCARRAPAPVRPPRARRRRRAGGAAVFWFCSSFHCQRALRRRSAPRPLAEASAAQRQLLVPIGFDNVRVACGACAARRRCGFHVGNRPAEGGGTGQQPAAAAAVVLVVAASCLLPPARTGTQAGTSTTTRNACRGSIATSVEVADLQMPLWIHL